MGFFLNGRCGVSFASQGPAAALPYHARKLRVIGDPATRHPLLRDLTLNNSFRLNRLNDFTPILIRRLNPLEGWPGVWQISRGTVVSMKFDEYQDRTPTPRSA